MSAELVLVHECTSIPRSEGATNEFSFIHHLDIYQLIAIISGHPPLKQELYTDVMCLSPFSSA